ncbi:MAG: AAA family ATPase [Candidatus Scalinduaceae bacterium]
MYLTEVIIKNVRCCKNLKLSFDGKPESILIVGDNGDGKSTVVRSIAMGLCDESSAAALLRDLPGDFVRENEQEAFISVTFKNIDGKLYKIETEIKSLKAFEKIRQRVYKVIKGKKEKVDPDLFPWEDIFVSAYGAGTRTQGTEDYNYYVPVDAVYPLFKYDVPLLQNPELAFRRIADDAQRRGRNTEDKIKRAKQMSSYLLDLLKKALNLDSKDRVYLTSTGLKVKSTRWGKVELGALGDGYRAVTTCVLDLLSWWMLSLKLHDKSIYTNRSVKGIVLIDEVEQHLHPRWQIKMVQILSELFPDVQFILTSHSPLVISGYKGTSIYQLEKGICTVKKAYGWLPENVYREIMGLEKLRSLKMEEEIQRYKELNFLYLKDKLSNKDRNEMNRIKKELLRILPSTDPIVLTSELENLSKKF